MQLPILSDYVAQKVVEVSYGTGASSLERAGITPSSCGGSGAGVVTQRCDCPGSSTVCSISEQCVCDFYLGARCLPPGGVTPQVIHF